MASRAKKDKIEDKAVELKKENTKKLEELQKLIQNESDENLGEVYQVMGAVVDVKFKSTKALPAILSP